MRQVNCSLCGNTKSIMTGHYNRAKKIGANMYCSKKCSHKARRGNKSKEQKIEEKRIYDMDYREKNRESLRVSKSVWFAKDYKDNAEKYMDIRISRMEAHVKYCKQPAYKEKKHIYDRKRYAQANFGNMWESHIIIMSIEEEIEKHLSKYEIGLKNKTINKALNRSRNGQTKRGYT